ncbi:hypothetical protein BGX33_002396, partial [Mortierella sp. NVP41]
IIVPLLLADAFDITACSEQAVKDAHYTHFEIRLQRIEDRPAVLETGLTIGDTVYKPFCPTPPGLRLEKLAFRHMPPHYKHDDMLELFGKYGTVYEIGMFYIPHPKCKVYTQDGYVLLENSNNDKSTNTTTSSKPSAKKDTIPKIGATKDTNAPPAKDVQQQLSSNPTKAGQKRNGKKRPKKTHSTAADMEGPPAPAPVGPQSDSTPNNPDLIRGLIGVFVTVIANKGE